jgi:hypothetical protein
MVRVQKSSHRARFANMRMMENDESMANNAIHFRRNRTIMQKIGRTIG